MIARPSRAASNWRPPALPTLAASPLSEEAAERADVLRTVTFYIALALVFMKFAMLQEIQTYVMHFNGRLMYILGVPALLGVLLSGGIRRALYGAATRYWYLFSLWLLICVPFSSWKSDSFRLARGFLLYQLIMLLVIAGLVSSWKEFRKVANAIGIAAVLNLVTARIFGGTGAERLSLEFGTVGNSNDYAAHLLLTLPFLLLFVYNSRSYFKRIAVFALLGVGALLILKTGSRGALLALICDVLFVFFRGSSRQRIVLLCLVPLTAAAVVPFLSSEVRTRILSFSSSEANVSTEAMESSEARGYLIRKAIEYSFEYPLFGVGPGQFSNFEGGHNKVIGRHGLFHSAHNSFILAFAEDGMPGGILFLTAYISTFLLLNRTYRRAKARADSTDIKDMAFCIMLAMTGFTVAITFLNFTYLFYGPALSGLAISLWRSANLEFARRDAAASKAVPRAAGLSA